MGGEGLRTPGSPFQHASAGAARRPVSVSSWPLYAVWVLSALALVVVIAQDPLWSGIAYAVLVVASSVLLLLYRMSLVRATRSAHGAGAVLGVRRLERWSVFAVVVAAVANGVIIGLWLGSLEVWFS